MPKDQKNRVGVVYSTDPNFNYTYDEKPEQDTLPVGKQLLQVHFDSKRKGKGMTVIDNFIGRDQDRKDLARDIKIHCGSGGSIDGSSILVQGDKRQQVADFLTFKGYKVKRRN